MSDSYKKITDWTDVESALQSLDENFQYVIGETVVASSPKEAHVDYNNYTIINLGEPVGETSPVRLKDLTSELKGDTGPRGSAIKAGTTFPNFTDSVDGDLFIDTSTGNMFRFNASIPTWGGSIGNVRGPSGDGSGDLVASANLSDVSSISLARSNLGLRPNVDIQSFSVPLDAISSIDPTLFVSADPGLVVFSGFSDATLEPISSFMISTLSSANSDEASSALGFTDIVFKSVGSEFGEVPNVGSDFFKKSNINSAGGSSYTVTYAKDAGNTIILQPDVDIVVLDQNIGSGAVVSIYNPPSNSPVSLSRVSPTLMYLSGSTVDKNLTISSGGLVTIFLYDTNKAVVSGSGVF